MLQPHITKEFQDLTDQEIEDIRAERLFWYGPNGRRFIGSQEPMEAQLPEENRDALIAEAKKAVSGKIRSN